MKMRVAIPLLLSVMLCACGKQATPVTSAAPTAPSAASPATEATSSGATESMPLPAATFINKVWEVSDSSAVAKGTLYVFLSEGTLVIASSTGTPSFGKWTQTDGKLTMIEEGIAYPTDILGLTADTFRIRSHNPGEPVTIDLSLAR